MSPCWSAPVGALDFFGPLFRLRTCGIVSVMSDVQLVAAPGRGRRGASKCSCGCGGWATKRVTVNGVCLTAGCELHVRRVRRSLRARIEQNVREMAAHLEQTHLWGPPSPT